MNGLAAAQPAMTDDADGLNSDVTANERAGGASAVERLVCQHGERVRRLVERLTAWSPDAADLTQDVFASAIVSMHQFRGECAMETWLTRIAIHRCRRWQRRERLARLWRKSVVATRRTDGASASDGMLRDETHASVRLAVASLPAKYREVVVLRYLEERSACETAATLGIRVNTVDVRLHRARTMLAEALAPLNAAE